MNKYLTKEYYALSLEERLQKIEDDLAIKLVEINKEEDKSKRESNGDLANLFARWDKDWAHVFELFRDAVLSMYSETKPRR